MMQVRPEETQHWKMGYNQAWEEASRDIDRLRAEKAELEAEEPGTPLGRLKAIADFATSKGWCTGAESKPAELFVIERAEKTKAELDRLRAENEELRHRLIHTLTCELEEHEIAEYRNYLDKTANSMKIAMASFPVKGD
jgi:hypothetical protein